MLKNHKKVYIIEEDFFKTLKNKSLCDGLNDLTHFFEIYLSIFCEQTYQLK